MVNQDILGGLRSALFKGETINKAMISFYNAGYGKEEIEEAAKLLHEQPTIQPIIPAPAKGKKQEEVQAQPVTAQVPAQPQEAQKEISEQKPLNKQSVSGYGKKKKSNTLIIILGVFLFLLVGLLTVIFLFKEQLVEFLNNLF